VSSATCPAAGSPGPDAGRLHRAVDGRDVGPLDSVHVRTSRATEASDSAAAHGSAETALGLEGDGDLNVLDTPF